MRLSTLFAAGLALALAPGAVAQCTGTAGTDFQQVTLREVNALPQSNIDALNAGGADLTPQTVEDNVLSPLDGQRIEFTAIIMTDPTLSSLGSPSTAGPPNRYHVFVRDVAAETDGVAGMGGQLVDGDGISSGSITDFFVGDEVTVCGEVSFFGTASQINPESITNNSNPRSPGDAILEPVVIATDDVHNTFTVNGEELSQVDWAVYPDFVNQYVRLESAELIQGIPGDRPNILISTPGEDASIRSDNLSACYDNRRQDPTYYPSGDLPPCVVDGPFTPPPTGIVNVQGYLTIRSGFDAFGSTVPGVGAFSISPFEASDFEIAVAPPIIALGDANLATSNGALVSANVTPGTAGNTVSSVVVDFETSSGATGQVPLSNTSGDDYEGTITGLTAGDFVTYTITATDNENAAAVTSEVSRRVIDGAVSSIFDIQATPDGNPGASGLTTGDPVAFDLDATVQSAFVEGGEFVVTIQDDPSLSPFTGVWIAFGATDPGLEPGDQITITEARVVEDFGLTLLEDVTFNETGSGDILGYKTVTTDIFNGDDGAATLEQHEGMILRFEDVVIVETNADASNPNSPFGEFLFSSDGTSENGVRADDLSDAVSYTDDDPDERFDAGNVLSFIQGPLYFSFNNYKLTPTDDDDFGQLIVSGEDDPSNTFGLAAYPNPSAGTVRVRFELAAPGDVTLRAYDATGRQVAVVAEGAFAADAHEVSASLDGLASGIYLLRLESEGAVATTRIAIVR